MTIELPEEEKIDLKHRLALEVTLMRKMLGGEVSQEQKVEWIDRFGEKISELIFAENEMGERLRELALFQQYEEGADVLLEELERDGEEDQEI